MKPERLQNVLRDRGKLLGQASRELAEGVSLESDRWFLSSLSVLDRGMQWTDWQLGSVVRRVRGWRSPKRVKERVQTLLRKEAKRAKLVVADEDFELFTDRIATLVELVLSGSIAIRDIVFEGERANPPAEDVQSSQSPERSEG